MVFLKVLVAGTLQSHARGGAPSPVLGEGRLEKSCLGSLLESSGFAWATTSSLNFSINKLPVLGYQTNFWESSLIGLHTWA